MKHASLATRAKNSFGKMGFKENEVVEYFFLVPTIQDFSLIVGWVYEGPLCSLLRSLGFRLLCFDRCYDGGNGLSMCVASLHDSGSMLLLFV